MTTFTYDPATDAGLVRLLVNDVADPWVFSDQEITGLLTLEGGSVKRAAAQAIDANAGNELLASKVITTQSISTNGAALATAMHALADGLRAQADTDEGEGFFEFVPPYDCTSTPWWC